MNSLENMKGYVCEGTCARAWDTMSLVWAKEHRSVPYAFGSRYVGGTASHGLRQRWHKAFLAGVIGEPWPPR